MKQIIIIILIIVGAAGLIFSFTYGKEHLRYNSMMSAIDESMRIASIKSLDNSARVKSGEARISEDIFEKTFKKQMKISSNYKIDNKKYLFEYLKTDDGALKAIKVAVYDDKGTMYPRTYVANISSKK
ncbi:hypothetical protein [Bacillus pumilus]|uniref:hypothetical protein n=1 Tax=Bacillus pumilus TaxID=1408 RepID=UPI002111CDBC|nr:hypothetical protein [Bacillus pumilus]UUD44646.1 hypothetical protein NPA43_19110 [Bacillus pumilus]